MGPMLHGEFLDTISYYQAIFLYLKEIQKAFDPDTLLPNLPDEPPTFWHRFRTIPRRRWRHLPKTYSPFTA